MNRRRIFPTLALLAALGACGERPDPEPEATTVPEWVENVAAAAKAIEQRPDAIDSILAAHDMTRALFDSLIYEVAADSALTAAYEEARAR